MEIKPDAKLFDLLREYPFLLEFLANYNPEYQKLRNPILRNTVGRVATLEKIAEMGKVPVDKLMADISEAIRNAPDLSEEREKRKEALKELLRQLHEGRPLEELKPRFAEIAGDVSPAEIGAIEQELVREGLDPQEITRLCSLHVQLFQEAMEKRMAKEFPGGHPLRAFQEENKRIANAISELRAAVAEGNLGRISKAIGSLSILEEHYIRKENALFPLLEKHGITAPPQVMWAVHDQIRAMLKRARELLDKNDMNAFAQVAENLASEAEGMITKEENILFPMLMETLSADEWVEVGRKPAGDTYKISLQTGQLSPKQVDLILRTLPLDITFVDENDEVRYYSEGERIFPRFPEVIGRKVQNCHPPKSLHVVQRILDEFRAGTKSVAEFWINRHGRLIHIRYFAVRDEAGRYMGTLELTQDITDIKNLEGERRLLDWE
jgi:PAS domain S-box-containing protein